MSAAPIWGLIPVKRLGEAKLRLAGVLSPAERAGLAAAMAEDVLAAALAARGLAGVAVATSDPAVAALARRLGARVLPDQAELGLNAAIGGAASRLSRDGAAGLLVLPADVPLVLPADIAALVEGHGDGRAVSLAAAAADGGSNALVSTPVDAIPFRFGAGSAALHREAALAAGIVPRHVSLPRLARDIDRPDDLAAFLGEPSPTRSHGFLAALDGAPSRFGAPMLLETLP